MDISMTAEDRLEVHGQEETKILKEESERAILQRVLDKCPDLTDIGIAKYCVSSGISQEKFQDKVAAGREKLLLELEVFTCLREWFQTRIHKSSKFSERYTAKELSQYLGKIIGYPDPVRVSPGILIAVADSLGYDRIEDDYSRTFFFMRLVDLARIEATYYELTRGDLIFRYRGKKLKPYRIMRRHIISTLPH